MFANFASFWSPILGEKYPITCRDWDMDASNLTSDCEGSQILYYNTHTHKHKQVTTLLAFTNKLLRMLLWLKSPPNTHFDQHMNAPNRWAAVTHVLLPAHTCNTSQHVSHLAVEIDSLQACFGNTGRVTASQNDPLYVLGNGILYCMQWLLIYSYALYETQYF